MWDFIAVTDAATQDQRCVASLPFLELSAISQASHQLKIHSSTEERRVGSGRQSLPIRLTAQTLQRKVGATLLVLKRLRH